MKLMEMKINYQNQNINKPDGPTIRPNIKSHSIPDASNG